MTVNGDASWAAKLREDFPAEEIGLRPQVWCADCRDYKKSPRKFCGKKAGEPGGFGVDHVLAKCGECGQKVTKAHMHLSYVGHAHATSRLLDADPEWTWRPARDIPPEVLIAAIGSGDLAIVQAVLSAYPPKITELALANGNVERVMWGELVLHDENGREIITPGVGDAIGKAWGPNAVKEMIGDLLRNAGMRRGLALNLWMKEDAERAQHERRGAGDGYSGSERATVFDDDAKDKPGPPARRAAGKAAAGPAVPPGINPQAQAAADMAWQIRQAPDGTLDKLQAAHDTARKNRLLGLHCTTPWDRELQGKTTVLKVFARAREELESAG